MTDFRPSEPRPRPSLWAIVAFLCSVSICPGTAPLGLVFGGYALRLMRRDPSLGGRGLAIAAVVIASLTTAAWTGGAFWWHTNVRRPLLEGPRPALEAGFRGDVTAFRAGLGGAPRGSDDEAAAFLGTLVDRYGGLVTILPGTPDEDAANRPVQGRIVVPYRLQFSRGEAAARAGFDVGERGFAWLLVLDERDGHLVYPASARGEALGDAGG